MPVGEFTLIVPYYRNPLMLREQLKTWELYSSKVKLVLVDDGSPEPAVDVVREHASPALQERIAIYRILVDIPWNRGGARNLGAREAKTRWLVHVDIDHVMPPDSALALCRFDAQEGTWYRFERWRKGRADETRKKDKIPAEKEWGQIHPHMDSYLVTRSLYWKAGGYDEDYSGCLGGGSPFLKQLERLGKCAVAPPTVRLHVYTRSVCADASDMHLSRDRDEYARRRKQKDNGGAKPAENPIRFDWIRETTMYPQVAGEFATIEQLKRGKSIARFGDGELKILDGKGYTRELQPVPRLTEELRALVKTPAPGCLVGIPTMDPAGTKYNNWIRHKTRFTKYFRAGDGNAYVSSLITRPDCGAWLETKDYYEHVISAWADKKRIAVLSEPQSKLLAHVRLSHRDVVHVACPMYHAYAQIDSFERALLAAGADIALLSCGPTATALANRLARQGLQALDLGSIGGFLLRWRVGNGKRQGSYQEERGY